MMCKDANCISHRSDIECFNNDIIPSLEQSVFCCIPSCTSADDSRHVIPGWNEYVKEHHAMLEMPSGHGESRCIGD